MGSWQSKRKLQKYKRKKRRKAENDEKALGKLGKWRSEIRSSNETFYEFEWNQFASISLFCQDQA